MDEIDTAAIRTYYDIAVGEEPPNRHDIHASVLADALDEIDALRARLAAVEAEMVRMGRDHTVRLQVRDEEENALRARLVEVEAERDHEREINRGNGENKAWIAVLRSVAAAEDRAEAAEARLAEVEAERDGFDSDFRDLIAAHSAAEKECTDLRARLAEVEALLDEHEDEHCGLFVAQARAIARGEGDQ